MDQQSEDIQDRLDAINASATAMEHVYTDPLPEGSDAVVEIEVVTPEAGSEETNQAGKTSPLKRWLLPVAALLVLVAGVAVVLVLRRRAAAQQEQVPPPQQGFWQSAAGRLRGRGLDEPQPSSGTGDRWSTLRAPLSERWQQARSWRSGTSAPPPPPPPRWQRYRIRLASRPLPRKQ